MVKGIRESNDDKSHAKLLTIFIDEVLKELNLNYNQLDAVAVSKGPGSYTGLRIGVSTAKGLCYAKNIPLIAINTLESMANGIIHSDIKNQVYSAFFNSEGKFLREVEAEIIDENSYVEILKNQQMIFFGDGSEKIKNIITNENAIFLDEVFPSASSMTELSEQAFKNKQFEDVAYFEPFYLKDFIATIPKKNIFN